MSNKAYDAFTRFGAEDQLRYKLRNSYALLGWSGYGSLDAVTQVMQTRIAKRTIQVLLAKLLFI